MVMITKANGERVMFDQKRLFRSLVNAGASEETANKVMGKIGLELHDGISTRKIYHMAFKLLRRLDSPTASRYEIKWAMMRLGEKQGFSFEQYMARLFTKMGYNVIPNVIVNGKHISHEVDLVLEKDGERIMVECKHRSNPATMIHVKVPLYIYARFLDLSEKYNKAWIVTNTRFTNQAIKYSNGVGIKLVGWDKSSDRSLQSLIDTYKVYPITVLRSVDKDTLTRLLNQNIVVVCEILEKPVQSLNRILGKEKAAKVIEEAKKLLKK
ncbi:MAG: restriction endonuclease [Candidatus Woesearchaeota archaeon]